MLMFEYSVLGQDLHSHHPGLEVHDSLTSHTGLAVTHLSTAVLCTVSKMLSLKDDKAG